MNAQRKATVGTASTRGYVFRAVICAAALVAYGFAFLSLHPRIDSAAFLLGVIPCVIAGALLGVRGGLVVVVATAVIDRHLAITIGLNPHTGAAAGIVSLATKAMMAVATGLIAQSAQRLRGMNRQLAEEVRLRRESELRLEESERRYRALVESAGEGVGLFDINDRCIVANAAMATALGKTQSEIEGHNFASHLDEASQERVHQRRVAGSSAVSSYEVVPRTRPDGLLLVTETRLARQGSPDARDTGESATLRVVSDLSYRLESEKTQRELERQLQRNQALQSLAVLAGGVAHDFNNLLSGIIGNAEFALRRVPPEASSQLSQCLREILEFANEAGQLSRQMLAYAGRRSLATGVIDVNPEVREALRLLHSTIESQAILHVETAEGLPPVKADRLQLRQVVTNLVINALESMSGKRGTLSIRTQARTLERGDLLLMKAPESLPPGEYVSVSVSDTGVGLPQALMERIFEPFFSTKSAGRGMGLAASMGIVRSHHGWLRVTSEPDCGSTFELLLPRAEQPREPPGPAPTPVIQPLPKKTILLIDDEAAVRAATSRILTELGQRVIAAETGQRGVQLLTEHLPDIDLVLLDLTMPELSGPEVLERLVALRADLPILVTSGFHPSDATDLLLLPNVVGFLEKPHTTANLQATIAAAFAK